MDHSQKKVAILGVGRVGAATAFRIMSEELCGELALADMDQDKARAEAADLQDAAVVSGSRVRVRAGGYYDCADACLCILAVAARGLDDPSPRDRLNQAAAVMGRVIPSLMATGFNGVLLVLSNPVEPMTWLAQQLSDLPDAKVLGHGAVLDAARLRRCLAESQGVGPEEIQVPVIGMHNGDLAVPWEHASIAGRPILERIPNLDANALFNTAAEISYKLRAIKGAASFGAAASAARIARAVLEDSGEILPVCAMPHGEYGLNGLYLSLPCAVGAEGVKRVQEYNLDMIERAKLSRIAKTIHQYITEIAI